MAALGLAACGGESSPSAPDTAQSPAQSAQDTADEVAPNLVVLAGEGLSAGPERFYFAAGQSEVDAALARALGKPADGGELSECGAGRMEYSSYSGGLTVNFMDGQLVGWVLGQGEGVGASNIAMGEGPAIGTPRAQVESLAGFTAIADSTLGDEFAIDGAPSGFFEEGKVAMLYAGVDCFFR